MTAHCSSPGPVTSSSVNPEGRKISTRWTGRSRTSSLIRLSTTCSYSEMRNKVWSSAVACPASGAAVNRSEKGVLTNWYAS